MRVNFIISGDVLDQNEQGIEAMLHVFGYEDVGYLYTDRNGHFILNIINVPPLKLLFKQHLIVNPKINENKYGSGIAYNFRVRFNKHIKLKVYPFSRRIVEV